MGATAIDPTIDPAVNLISSFTDSPAVEAVYGPGLVWMKPKTQQIEMGFAQSLTTKDHGRTWTMVLHPSLKFSDGTAFNAAAVAANIARLADPATGSSTQPDAAALSTRVVNATTLKITCTPANAQFPTTLSQEFAMVPSPTAVRAEGALFGAHPVGAGPFVAQSYVSGISWTFTRNKYYSRYAPGQPYLNSISIVSESSSSQMTAAIQTQAIQMANIPNQLSITQDQAAGLTVFPFDEQGGFFLAMNTSIPPFNELKARQAVYDIVDRTGVATVWSPGNPVSTNFMSPKSPFYDPKNNWPAPNHAQGQQLLDELAAEGHPLNFTVTWPLAAGLGNVAAYLQGIFGAYRNVSITANTEVATQYHAALVGSTFQMTGFGISAYVPTASQTLSPSGSLNYMKWNDPKVGAAFSDLAHTTSPTKEKQDWNVVTKELVQQVPVVFTQIGRYGIGYNRNVVRGIVPSETGSTSLWGQIYHV